MDEAIAKRLQIKAGRSARVFAAPKSLAKPLSGLPSTGKGPFDVVLLFAEDRAAVKKSAAAAIAAVGEGGILWIAYPKKTSKLSIDLDRDHGWEVLHEAGYDPVSQVALDETWSALRWKKDPAIRSARIARGSMLAPAAKPAVKPAARPAPAKKSATLKTQPGSADVNGFLDKLPEPRRSDARALLVLMTAASGHAPRMWGGGIVGFGDTHLRYPSGRELDWFLCGFSPRKDAHAIYGLLGDQAPVKKLLARLGKHTTGKGCLYVKKLSDVDGGVLAELVKHAAARKG